LTTGREHIDITDLRVDESYWPPGSSEALRRWLATTYDPSHHPALITNQREDGNNYIVAWEDDGSENSVSLLMIVHILLGHDLTDVPCPCGFVREDDPDEEDY
jgi:hypothetical protein